MTGLLLFLHVLGVIAWLGGGLGTMLTGITAKPFETVERLAVYRTMSALSRNLIGPGAVLVVVTCFGLSAPYMKSRARPGWLMAMKGYGLLGSLIALLIVTPTTASL